MTEDAATHEDAPADAETTPGFEELGITGPVLAAIKALGYETPSAIQRETIPLLLGGRDVLGTAQTGTGKTAAFALPILENLDLRQSKPQALVLAPTRELALQVAEAFEAYAAQMPGVHLLPVYGGQGYGVQLSALRRGVHIVVGTPGRIMDHLAKGTLDLSELKNLVLDEADEMLKMGFAEDVEQILAQTPEDKQVALFSATMPATIRRLAQQYLHDPEEISVKAKTTTNANITQRYLVVSYAQKVDALTRILEVENFEGMIVFVRTKNETETLAEKLRARGYSAAAINGDIPQPMRERTVGQLKDGKLDILVATDVAARGLDVERISHVVNFDIPTDTESYVHRIGRTGRAGRSGDAISFITPRERYLLKHIERATRQQPAQMQLPTTEDVNSTRLARFDDAITAALEETGRIEGFRDIIAHYVRHHDVPEADVAAALAVVAQGETPLLLDPENDALSAAVAADNRPPRTDRPDRAGGRDARDREPRTERRSRGDYTPYRIEVGRRHRVEPRQIVGALANEGGLGRDDFGAITIRPDFSIVELPANLDSSVLDRLRDTRISGRLIEIQRDTGRPNRGPRRDRDDRGRDDRGYGDRPRRDDRGYGDRPRRDDRPRDDRSTDARPPRKPRHKD
ncbi:DEAD/DEAH box helicase [Microbacterium azadirachtae]|uniref:ATP-dependent RNA helicase DeaD n=1 Tax=Microbacterium azadirachtae TaxID=582680 RepID=A0A0F0KWS9_9MICO|nr:DEAD/DEAH box helicase [Microbacterium azadirachtae]KJL24929.1 ATP-dependent RNA helicase DeaD [Microbacterium azadirachtae]UXW84520.1 DEAD/DEAH box helicase [Microbacterium azadirachtae]SDL32891.1 ATP-dependent RNA helicase CsdA [Microbacterium azadirachtae]SEF63049.1 ATP-dependent RNA helicase CsdA [Microbacterium azadirachtae]SEF63829.1 ATP-dependent RNA helicase CsdA [Microbacterium azadirachtae]